MPTDCISYQKSGYFTKLIVDYLDKKTELKSLYNRFPSLENFEAQVQEKKTSYTYENREILVSVLKQQYSKISISTKTNQNIELLLKTGADINIQDKNGWTALMVAIYRGKKEIVELLIKRKADLEIQNQMDETALIAA